MRYTGLVSAWGAFQGGSAMAVLKASIWGSVAIITVAVAVIFGV